MQAGGWWDNEHALIDLNILIIIVSYLLLICFVHFLILFVINLNNKLI